MRYCFNFAGSGIIILAIILISCKNEKAPTVQTKEISEITISSAMSGGTIVDEGSGNVLSHGICWSTESRPTTADKKTTIQGALSNYSDKCFGLEPGTTYFVRAYATNQAGTGYGAIETFTTLGSVPALTLLPFSEITPTSATFNGKVDIGYLATNVYFEYGSTTQYGRTFASGGNPFTGSSLYEVNENISDLTPATTYHVRLKAENQMGTSYSQDMTFETPGQPPVISTLPATDIKVASVRLGCSVDPNLLPTTITYEYGLTTDYGTSFTSLQSPVTADAMIDVSDIIKRLQANTTYHFRVKAENRLGIVYGEDLTFTTQPGYTDIDGNPFDIVTIGSQIWMKENLRTTTYNDNTPIPLATEWTDWLSWGSLTSPAYCNYTDDLPGYTDTYGPMYNWYAVSTGKLCPSGWHVPGMDEWNVLFEYLGGPDAAGAKMMETGTDHWISPNNVATNQSGFTAIPGGYRDGGFIGMGTTAAWLTSSEDDSGNSVAVGLYSGSGYNFLSKPKRNGFNIRCIKDN